MSMTARSTKMSMALTEILNVGENDSLNFIVNLQSFLRDDSISSKFLHMNPC